MIGASAQACSVLRPNWPFLKATRVKDLSNHLREEEPVRREGGGRSVGAWVELTCCSSCHAVGPCHTG